MSAPNLVKPDDTFDESEWQNFLLSEFDSGFPFSSENAGAEDPSFQPPQQTTFDYLSLFDQPEQVAEFPSSLALTQNTVNVAPLAQQQIMPPQQQQQSYIFDPFYSECFQSPSITPNSQAVVTVHQVPTLLCGVQTNLILVEILKKQIASEPTLKTFSEIMTASHGLFYLFFTDDLTREFFSSLFNTIIKEGRILPQQLAETRENLCKTMSESCLIFKTEILDYILVNLGDNPYLQHLRELIDVAKILSQENYKVVSQQCSIDRGVPPRPLPTAIVKCLLDQKINSLSKPKPILHDSKSTARIGIFFSDFRVKDNGKKEVSCYFAATFSTGGCIQEIKGLQEESRLIDDLDTQLRNKVRSKRDIPLISYLRNRAGQYTKEFVLNAKGWKKIFGQLDSHKLLPFLDVFIPGSIVGKYTPLEDIKAGLSISKRKSKKDESDASYDFSSMRRAERTDIASPTWSQLGLNVELLPYQKQAVLEALQVALNNCGFVLAHDTGLGKSIELAAFLQASQIKHGIVLILCPKAVLTKWQDELTNKGGFPKELVEILDRNNIGKLVITDKKILIVNYEMFLSLISDVVTNKFKNVCGYISLNEIIPEVSVEDVKLLNKKWSEIFQIIKDEVSEVQEQIKVKGSKRSILHFLPPYSLMPKIHLHIKEELKIEITLDALCKFILARFIFDKLVKASYIDNCGMVLQTDGRFLSQEEFSSWIFFDSTSEEQANYFDNSDPVGFFTGLGELIQNRFNEFAVTAIACDEFHKIRNSNSETTKHLARLNYRAYLAKSYRIMLTATPFQNNLRELWTLIDMINPGCLGLQSQFQKTFTALLSQVANGMIVYRENVEDLQNQKKYHETLEYVGNQFIALRAIVSSYFACLTKEDPLVQACMTLQPQLRMPTKHEQILMWSLSKHQKELISKMDAEALASACRGFAFHLAEDEEKSSVSGVKGIELLLKCLQIIDHPALQDYHDRLYPRRKKISFADLKQVIRDIIVEKYRGNVDDFLADSGKLLTLVEYIIPIISAPEHFNQVLCLINSLPTAAILEVILEYKLPQGMLCCSYLGELAQSARDDMLRSCNQNPSPYRVIILSVDAGGFGIDLNCITHIPVVDGSWNPFETIQALGRGFRVTNVNEAVTVSYMRCKEDPVDTKQWKIAAEKKQYGEFFFAKNKEAEFSKMSETFVQWLQKRALFALRIGRTMSEEEYKAVKEVVRPKTTHRSQTAAAFADQVQRSFFPSTTIAMANPAPTPVSSFFDDSSRKRFGYEIVKHQPQPKKSRVSLESKNLEEEVVVANSQYK